MKKNMSDYKVDFLIKSLMGRTVELNNPEEVIKKCIELAYGDMMIGGRYYLFADNKNLSKENKLALKSNICKELFDILKDNKYSFSVDIIDKIQGVFANDEVIGDEDGKRFVTRYGLAQKLVNMTFKYLYIFEDYTGGRVRVGACDCPIDSVIISKLGLENKYKWTKLNKDQYVELQNNISNALAVKKSEMSFDDELNRIGRLAYDMLEW